VVENKIKKNQAVTENVQTKSQTSSQKN